MNFKIEKKKIERFINEIIVDFFFFYKYFVQMREVKNVSENFNKK